MKSKTHHAVVTRRIATPQPPSQHLAHTHQRHAVSDGGGVRMWQAQAEAPHDFHAQPWNVPREYDGHIYRLVTQLHHDRFAADIAV